MTTMKKLVNFFHGIRIDILLAGLIDRLLSALVKKLSANRRPKASTGTPRSNGGEKSEDGAFPG